MFSQQKLCTHHNCIPPNVHTLLPSLYYGRKVLALMQGHWSSDFHLILHVIISFPFFATSFFLTPGSFSSAHKQALVCAIKKKKSFLVSLSFSNFCILSVFPFMELLKEFSFISVFLTSHALFNPFQSVSVLTCPLKLCLSRSARTLMLPI